MKHLNLISFALVLSLSWSISIVTCVSFDLPKFQWTILHNWTRDDGTFRNSYSNSMLASNGKVYAVANQGAGNASYGGIYSIDPTNNFAYAELFHLTGQSTEASPGLYPGSYPYYGLVEVPGSNKLWGLVYDPYVNFRGGLFSWNFNTGAYRVEYNFTENFYGSPMYDSTSNLLLWVTSRSGQSDKGRVHAFNPSSSTGSIKADMPSNPLFSNFEFDGGFTKAPNGKFYVVGYATNGNAVYSFDLGTNQVSLEWNTTDVSISTRSYTFLTLYPNGKLYWGDYGRPTNILEFDPNTAQVKIVAVLDSNSEGYYINENPLINIKTQFGDLLLAATGNGNPYNGGSLAIFDPVTGFHASIYNATHTEIDGDYFEASPIQLADGSLVGNFFDGGSAGEGVVYRLTGFTIPPPKTSGSVGDNQKAEAGIFLSCIFTLALILNLYIC